MTIERSTLLDREARSMQVEIGTSENWKGIEIKSREINLIGLAATALLSGKGVRISC